jgi:hypothetical protein
LRGVTGEWELARAFLLLVVFPEGFEFRFADLEFYDELVVLRGAFVT